MSGQEDGEGGLTPNYWQACRLAEKGRYDEARRLYAELESIGVAAGELPRVLVRNDRGPERICRLNPPFLLGRA